MPDGKLRSRTLRKVFRKAPGGRNVLHRVPRAPSKARCGACGAELKAVPRKNSTEMKKLPKTAKRPERPFGGVLCSRCMRRTLIMESRDGHNE